jgi:hypothetical protein
MRWRNSSEDWALAVIQPIDHQRHASTLAMKPRRQSDAPVVTLTT